MSSELTCFKAYDIRGRVPGEINRDIAYRIGYAFASYLSARHIVVGHDIRLTSPELCDAVLEGIRDTGCDVTHIGQCGTEEIYFATFANQQQLIKRILWIEFLCLSGSAALGATIISLLALYPLNERLFQQGLSLSLWQALPLGLALIVTFCGLLASRKALQQPALSLLRSHSS